MRCKAIASGENAAWIVTAPVRWEIAIVPRDLDAARLACFLLAVPWLLLPLLSCSLVESRERLLHLQPIFGRVGGVCSEIDEMERVNESGQRAEVALRLMHHFAVNENAAALRHRNGHEIRRRVPGQTRIGATEFQIDVRVVGAGLARAVESRIVDSGSQGS